VATEAGAGGEGDAHVALHETARSRYLNYALSVITSRAIPDVRDGLKPVQRRVLYTMGIQGITAEARYRKCAKVVGDVMGNYHPHGDSAIYEALVRLAQPFSMRYPLIEGSGNFGSLDGDSAAAMRYTECRLAPIAGEMLTELKQETVHFRPNYDGSTEEPVVLPARLPNLLLNGATGIAVGLATSIPPHHLGEVATSLIKLLENFERKTHQLCCTKGTIQGPDFPTGGRVLNAVDEIRAIYQSGSGAIRLRATWQAARATRSGRLIHVTSIPYMVNKAQLVEQIAGLIEARKLPPLVDVRDLSTDDVCIELELARGAEDEKVMAYLFKHTQLETTFQVNLTCLVPTENPELGRPQRLGLREILQHFLRFRLEVVTRRLEHELEQLARRIHVLEGFAFAFDVLDEIIRIIRGSDGKQDAAAKILERFGAPEGEAGEGKGLDADQVEAILELKLYRLAKLEIRVVLEELEKRRARAQEIEALLAEPTEDADGNPLTRAGRWGMVREEIEAVRDAYGGEGDTRRTRMEPAGEEPGFSAEEFIVDEDNVVIVTRDGWVKRQKEVKDLATTRLREGDAVLAAEPGSTRATIVFFSNLGVAYTARIAEIPATTGHGEPVQKLFKMKDGERVVAALSLDPRRVGPVTAEGEDVPPVHAIAATSGGMAMRFSLATFLEPSTRTGRRYCRPGSGAEVVGVETTTGEEILIAATRGGRAVLTAAEEVKFLAGAGKGVILIKLEKDDRLLGFKCSSSDRDLLTVRTTRGAEQNISTAKYEVSGRGGRGRVILKRGGFESILAPPPSVPELGGSQ